MVAKEIAESMGYFEKIDFVDGNMAGIHTNVGRSTFQRISTLIQLPF